MPRVSQIGSKFHPCFPFVAVPQISSLCDDIGLKHCGLKQFREIDSEKVVHTSSDVHHPPTTQSPCITLSYTFGPAPHFVSPHPIASILKSFFQTLFWFSFVNSFVLFICIPHMIDLSFSLWLISFSIISSCTHTVANGSSSLL